MSITQKIVLTMVAVITAPAALLSSSAFATINENIDLSEDGFGIAVSPPSLEFDIVPGVTSTEQVRVRNVGQEETKLRVSVTPLTVTNEYYTNNSQDGTTRTEITRWTTISVDPGCSPFKTGDDGELYIHMRVKEECNISFSVAPPSNAPFGSQHMSIFFEEFVEDESEGGVQMIRSIGASVYATNRTGQNSTNGPCGKVKNQKVPFWVFQGPLKTTSLIENCGVLDFHVTSAIKVTNIFGAIIYEDTEPVDKLLLAETERQVENIWEDTSIGLFKVKQTVTVLGETYEVEKWTFLIPVWLLVILLACVLVIILSIAHGRRKKASRRRGR